MDKSVLTTLTKLGLSDVAKRVRISAAWSQAVGPEIACRTEPQSLHRGLLVVRSTSAAWQNELTFLKAEILAKLNAALGKESAVRDLRVVGGSLHTQRAEPDRPKWLDEAPTQDDLDVARDASRRAVHHSRASAGRGSCGEAARPALDTERGVAEWRGPSGG